MYRGPLIKSEEKTDVDFHTYDVKSSLANIRKRPRRLRQSEGIRKLARETSLSAEDLVMPLFVCDGKNLRVAIPSLPGIYRLSMDLIVKECEELYQSGIPGVVLFGLIPEALKDKSARESYNSQGLYQKTIRLIKQNIPDLVLITDVAMDPYSSDGHDGIVDNEGRIVNDETLEILAKMALTQAEAGADIVAPSDMMDGRVGYIRDALDEQGFTNVGILAYSAKYASSFYGPFRDALGSTPKKGDKMAFVQLEDATGTAEK
ncbi:porphobilinogen synthase [PVC group bacterium]|nr:porphobilinogen synthase [PVC group bacterium]